MRDACWRNALNMAHVLAFFGSTSKPHPAELELHTRSEFARLLVSSASKHRPDPSRPPRAARLQAPRRGMLHPHASRKRRIAVPPLEPKKQSTPETGRSLTLAHLTRSNKSPRTDTHRPRADAMMPLASLLTVGIMVTRLLSGGRTRAGLLKFFLFSSQPLPHSNKLLTLHERVKL